MNLAAYIHMGDPGLVEEWLAEERAETVQPMVYQKALLQAVMVNDFEMVQLVYPWVKSFNYGISKKSTGLLHRLVDEVLSADDDRILQLFLSQKKMDWTILDEYSQTPLMRAIQTGLSTNRLKQLLESNLDLAMNWSSVDGSTALSLTAEHQQIELSKLLLKHGAEVNTNLAIYWAVLHEDLPLIYLLIHARVNLNLVDSEGTTPLMLAAQIPNYLIVHLLLYYGANRYLRNKAGLTALEMAHYSGHLNNVRLLIRPYVFPQLTLMTPDSNEVG